MLYPQNGDRIVAILYTVTSLQCDFLLYVYTTLPNNKGIGPRTGRPKRTLGLCSAPPGRSWRAIVVCWRGGVAPTDSSRLGWRMMPRRAERRGGGVIKIPCDPVARGVLLRSVFVTVTSPPPLLLPLLRLPVKTTLCQTDLKTERPRTS